MIRTRFAPSPTGYLHIGGARTALFCWAYAKKHGGKFILRVEDTDLERSTQQSVQAILDGMSWLGLDCDEGPFYQMQRLHRYQEVAQQLLDAGHAYHCYCSKEDLEAMREAQRARGEKPRYDGRWRDSKETPPAGVTPVLRFKTPLAGDVTWDDQVKGLITVNNAELDDLVILRGDGVPMYNFGVVVDDIDMEITHVIRGDDHVNNTPRQINIYKALGVTLPKFAHLPMILGGDGERLSKRHGAVSVMQYRDDGFLPEALVNYLARLGWSHGDAEKFSREQLVEWFDLAHVSKSAARFDLEKLRWLNAQYQKEADNERLASIVKPFFEVRSVNLSKGPPLSGVVALMKGRTTTAADLSMSSDYFYSNIINLPLQVKSEYDTAEIKPALMDLKDRLSKLTKAEWKKDCIDEQLKAVVAQYKLKFPKIAMPLRVMISGGTQTPSIDATLELIGRDEVLARMEAQLKQFPS